MKPVTWQDLQFSREQELYTQLRPVLERLKKSYENFARKSQQQEKEFIMHLSHSVKIDQLENMARLLHTVNQRLCADLKVNLFLFRSPVSNALCTPRSSVQAIGQKKEVVVLREDLTLR